MSCPQPAGSGVRAADPFSPPDRGVHRAARAGLALLLLGGGLWPLVWIGRGGFAVAATYGGLGGGWAQLLVALALGAGVVVGACLVAAARLLDRATPARWLLLTGVALAVLAAAVGAFGGFVVHSAAAARAEHACDDPVGRALVSFAEELEPGPLVVQDGELTRGREDGTCLVWVNLAPQADVATHIAGVAAARGWSGTEDGWLSPEGVALTYDVTQEPDTMALVELQGRRADPP